MSRLHGPDVPSPTSMSSSVLDSASIVAGSTSLASMLGPALSEATQARLHDIRWFRADWQRGGAATGYATFDTPDSAAQAVIKIPIRHAELRWTRLLQSPDPDQVIPRLLASGDELAGYDFAWLVLERLPVGPLGARWSDTAIPRMARAAARFHAATARLPVDCCPMRQPWDDIIKAARESVSTNSIAQRQRWLHALRLISDRLDRLVEVWRARPITEWIHGDLHPANAMCRADGPDAPVVLIDLAEVRPGHWVEDAVYLERLLWTLPDRMKAHKPVREIARARRELNLPVDEDYTKYAAVRRVLLAASAPKFLRTEGSPAHLAACLERLESAPAELKQYGL